ncbi:serine protease [Corallococcus sp. CA049B]|uniref:S1 family peptidase n=1 Tax=Corallococcus sp. CA049B TaxID=2316730 RepID=UPI000EA3771D|nr:serine protease [Corallococcus sp. CA049B]RKG84401.1 serine protease [Corallococcus sp. CA049B]
MRPTPLRIQVERPECQAEFGTGWLLLTEYGARVVTAFHVVGDAPTQQWWEKRAPGTRYTARLPEGAGELTLCPSAQDFGLDLALLEVTGGPVDKVSGVNLSALLSHRPEARRRWCCEGYPLSSGGRLLSMVGQLTSVSSDGHRLQLLMDTRIPYPDGASGAAVIDEDTGTVIGVLTSALEDPDTRQLTNVVYASSARVLAELVGRKPVLLAGPFRGLHLLWWAMVRPELWARYFTVGGPPTLPPDFSLSHLAAQQPERHSRPTFETLLLHCAAGAALVLLLALLTPLLLCFSRPELRDTYFLRHLIHNVALTATFGVAISVGLGVAAGMASATVGSVLGALGVSLSLVGMGDSHASLGHGASAGGALGAAAMVFLQTSREAVPGTRESRLHFPWKLGFACSVVIALFALGYWAAQEWVATKHPAAMFVAGAVLGGGLGLLNSLPGWQRLRAAGGIRPQMVSSLLTWSRGPLVVGAGLACWVVKPGQDELLGNGLAIGVLAGLVLAAALSVIHALSQGLLSARYTFVFSILGLVGVCLVLLMSFSQGSGPWASLHDIPQPARLLMGVLAGLASSVALLQSLRRVVLGLTALPSSASTPPASNLET